jgi:CRP-like cAMP-binding protein
MERLALSQDCYSKLLDMLPRKDLMEVSALMSVCEVRQKEVIAARNQPIEYVYFPYDAVFANVLELQDGQMPEIALIGSEGLAPIHALLGAERTLETVICKLGGTCLRMRLQDFRHEAERNPRFRFILQLYAQAYQSQLHQRVACSRLHTLEQRYASSMLATMDRAGPGPLPLTQDFVALLLGVRRPGVSHVAQQFLTCGAIDYSRGKMRILDRRALEERACECYLHIRSEYEKILGVQAG